MIVIADTSPLNYLIQIECDALLAKLYDQVFVPSAVLHELRHPGSPAKVRLWLEKPPSWIEVRSLTQPPDITLRFLDPGESEAIQLAQEQQADLLLIDDRQGRLEAKRRGLATTGTLGVLVAAAELGFVDAGLAYQLLVNETTFRTTPELEARFLKR